MRAVLPASLANGAPCSASYATNTPSSCSRLLPPAPKGRSPLLPAYRLPVHLCCDHASCRPRAACSAHNPPALSLTHPCSSPTPSSCKITQPNPTTKASPLAQTSRHCQPSFTSSMVVFLKKVTCGQSPPAALLSACLLGQQHPPCR